MTDVPSANPERPRRTLSLDDLIPTKVPVKTSLGTLYVRHARASDWKFFESDDATLLGHAAVKQLVGRIEDKNDDTPLAAEDINALATADLTTLAQVIAKQSRWGDVPEGPAFEALGHVVKRAKELEKKRHEEMRESLRKSIDFNYKFLEKSALDKLKEQVTGISDIQSGLSSGLLRDALKSSMSPSHVLNEALRGMKPTRIPNDLERPKATIEPPQFHMPPLPEETPVGRASIESARYSREVSRKMDALVDVVGGLNQTLITDVLPAWFNQAEKDSKTAQASLRYAAWGIALAILTTVFSIVATISSTRWQVSTTRQINHENTAQQQNVETLLREQLAAQQKFNEQQARDAEQLRELMQQQQVRDAEMFRALERSTKKMPTSSP